MTTTMPFYYLIIGRAGAGKTTYAKQVLAECFHNGIAAVILDGDALRNIYKNDDYTDTGRWNNVMDCIELAERYMELDVVPIIAMVCPKDEYRAFIENSLGINSRLVYIEGGKLWEGTDFDEPNEEYTRIDWRSHER